MQTAFKEWAVVVDALARGEQILILRKGGLHEGRGGFQVGHERFLLFPTGYHQQGESVVGGARERSADVLAGMPPEDVLRIGHFAEVVEWRELDSLEAVRALKGQHVWRDEVIEQRYEWGRSKGVFALAVRVYRLPESVELPMLESYGGCKSWIEIERDISRDGAEPVLSDEAFATRLAGFREVADSAAA